MKYFTPIIAILGLTLSCAPPGKLSKQKAPESEVQQEKPIHKDKQIAPGTCSLTITNCKIVKENGKSFLTAKVKSVSAYGAGFLTVFEKNQEIRISITKRQHGKIKDEKSMSCVISNLDGRSSAMQFALENI